MSTITRRPSRVTALVAIVLIAAGCRSSASADRPPPCLKTLVASGQAYTLDPGLTMAITTAMAYDHPELGRLVDAVADYQVAHPDTGVFEPDANDADVASLAYVLFVADLAAEPGPGDLSQLREYEQAARIQGMAGIYRVLQIEAGYPHTVDALRIPRLVVDQVARAREGSLSASQVIDLPAPECGASDEPG